ncbi:MAG: permease [Alphaproteobacteria bacterium]
MTALIASLKAMPRFELGGAWVAAAIILGLLGVLDRLQVAPTLVFVAEALLSTAPFIIFAIAAVSYLKASGAESLVARAFVGRERRMIVLAALVGGLAPFCSCQVIPFIAGLLALGTPLSAVMAFWLSSPLIDPPALLITAGALGWNFAVAKTIAAVGVGLLGGFAVLAATASGWFANPLRPRPKNGCAVASFTGQPVWNFWKERDRRETFGREARFNALFLFKWLTLAYLLESLLITYVPAESITGVVGGAGLGPIVLSALIGAPAYLNSYAAPALVAGLMQQGMGAGAAMAFMVGGAVSSLPAMTAVFALVKRPVFGAYVVLGFVGAVASGVAFEFAWRLGLG